MDGAYVGGGLCELSYHRSLALVKEEGKTSGACADEAYIGGACADGACAGGAVTFVGKGSSAIGRSFKTAEARAVDDIKGVNKRNLRR